jgi:hypothetical protein
MTIWRIVDLKSCIYAIQNPSTQTSCSIKHSYCRIFQNLRLFLSSSRTLYWIIMTDFLLFQMPLNGEFAKLMGYLTSVIFQLGLYCTLGSNLMNQVNVKWLFLLLKISCSFLYVDRLAERLISSSAPFHVFIISFLILNFCFCLFFFFVHYVLWLLFTGCKAAGKNSDTAYSLSY